MNCYEPGQVVVLPVTGGLDSFYEYEGQRDNRFSVVQSTEDALRHYAIETNWKDRFQAFPFVLQVPEGAEQHFSDIFSSRKYVRSSTPNYFVRPVSPPVDINDEFIERAMEATGSLPGASFCGTGVSIAIFDTGVEPSLLMYSGVLNALQPDTVSSVPLPSQAPNDPIGHGSTVARIINRICPGAQLYSFQCLGEKGSVGSVLAALFTAEAMFQPDIYNMSLAFTCDINRCSSCGNRLTKQTPITLAHLDALIESVYEGRVRHGDPQPLLIAAGGNNTNQLMLPAGLRNILAVGGYDITNDCIPPFASYREVPRHRFILAPSGLKGGTDQVATRQATVNRGSEEYFGTSFSTAFVTGIAGRYLCSIKGAGMCSQPYTGSYGNADFVIAALAGTADTQLTAFSPETHGFGLARYIQSYIPNSRTLMWFRIKRLIGATLYTAHRHSGFRVQAVTDDIITIQCLRGRATDRKCKRTDVELAFNSSRMDPDITPKKLVALHPDVHNASYALAIAKAV